jgi:hypothetical protein
MRRIINFTQPHGNRHNEAADTNGREGQLGFEQALELQQRLVVECDKVQLIRSKSRLFQAIGNRMARKTRIVLVAGKALFLRRGDDVAIHHDGGRAVMIEGRDPQNIHLNSSPYLLGTDQGHEGILEAGESALERAAGSGEIGGGGPSCQVSVA